MVVDSSHTDAEPHCDDLTRVSPHPKEEDLPFTGGQTGEAEIRASLLQSLIGVPSASSSQETA